MSDEFDVVVIGGGAAGLSALERLKRARLKVVLIEAGGRLGGRARTLRRGDLPLDAGCGWLHSADLNVIARRFEAAGVPIDKTPASWSRQTGGEGADPATRAYFARAYAAFEARLEAASEAGREGRASDHLTPGDPWNARLQAISTFYNGAELEEVSVLDYGAYVDTGLNWRAPNGYGAGLLSLFEVPEARLGLPARRIDRSGPVLRVRTDAGDLDARAVVLALPPTALARETPAIFPPLPEKTAAAAALPLGLANKAFLALTRPERFAPEEHLLGRIHEVQTAGYHLRPFGRAYVEAYFGGRHAEALEGEGPGALTAAALEELVRALGSDVREELSPLMETSWRSEPFIWGSYSHALPGHADARATLAEPVDDRIFFAGEATHPRFFSTAHGAFESGIRSAEEALRALGRSAP